MKEEDKKGLSGNALKLVAIIAMTIDHAAWTVWPTKERVWYIVLLHIIGRLTAPIMWFFVAEGCHYTHDRRKYLLRLFLFAVVSHFAYCFAFGMDYFLPPTGLFDSTSVMWGLFLAALSVFTLEKKEIPSCVRLILVAVFVALGFASDWSCSAVLAPVLLYRHRGDMKKQAVDIAFCCFIYAAYYFAFHDRFYGVLQLFAVLSVFFLRFYNGERGKWKGMKWFFYVYYPAHMALAGIARIMLEKVRA